MEKLDYKPYLNEDCTPFFENSVIRNLIELGAHRGHDYFGVVSHKLREKITITKHGWAKIKNIANVSDLPFSPQLFQTILLQKRPDTMSFQRHIPHDPISFADKFHPNFSKYFAEIMHKTGYKWTPISFENVFYCNFFVAKNEIYERYVTEMLAPAMDIMLEMPELFQNSNYPHALPEELKIKFNIQYYPYHPFLCERMYSYFVHIHKLKVWHF